MDVCINGFCGKMGQIIYKQSKKHNEINIVCGVDKYSNIIKCLNITDVAMFDNINNIKKVDAVIDFSHNSSLMGVLNYCVKNVTPLVLGTTGYNNEQIKKIEYASKFIPIFLSGNNSEGVYSFLQIVKVATHLLKEHDIEIIETHHKDKLDAPSGTAKMIFNEIKNIRQNANLLLGRTENCLKRNKSDVCIHSVRGGNMIGEHKVIFFDENEKIEISHNAYSKDIFVNGTFSALEYIKNKKNGIYNMKNIFDLK